MEHMLGLILLTHGRSHSNRRKETNEQRENEHARIKTIHGQTSRVWSLSIKPASLPISDTCHVSPECHLPTHRLPHAPGSPSDLCSLGWKPPGSPASDLCLLGSKPTLSVLS